MVSGQKPPDKNPPDLKPLVGFTIKEKTRFKYYPRTAKYCVHVKGSCVNIPASFGMFLAEN